MAGLSDLFAPPTPEQQTARILADTLDGAKNVNRSALDNALLMIWSNPYGLTPQQVFNILGTRAAALLQLKALIVPLLEAAFPGEPISDPKPANVNLVTNEDGTVTVTEIG